MYYAFASSLKIALLASPARIHALFLLSHDEAALFFHNINCSLIQRCKRQNSCEEKAQKIAQRRIRWGTPSVRVAEIPLPLVAEIQIGPVLHYVQHCITCNIVLRATLHYVQHCITCNIALRAK